MKTVIKFFTNYSSSSSNKLISRTLMKLAAIDRDWRPPKPKLEVKGGVIVSTGTDEPANEEFWLVDIVAETAKGASGAFIVHPIKKVDSILRLLPTQYTTDHVGGIIVVTPTLFDEGEERYYALPIQLRRKIAGVNTGKPFAYAVIVNHGGSPLK